jgi:hypothetical protein
VFLIQSFVSGALAPHAATSRWSYTVPSNKLALITYLQAAVNRFGAPTAAGIYQTEIRVGTSTFLIVRNWRSDVGVRDPAYIPHPIELAAGQSINAQTVDTSTGGTVTYEATLIGWELP